MSVVFPADAVVTVAEGEQAIVGYGDAMGIAADGVRNLQGPGTCRGQADGRWA